jgi:prophage regulatory protein
MTRKAQPDSRPELLSRDDVARLTGLSPATVERYRRKGNLPAPIRLGPNRIAWVRSELEAWIAKRIAERDAGANQVAA